MPIQALDAKGTAIACFPTLNPNQDKGAPEATPSG
jgi:hypothetical protein